MNQIRILVPQLSPLTSETPPHGGETPSGTGESGPNPTKPNSADSATLPNGAAGGGVSPHTKTTRDRRHTLGASEAPAVLGRDPYRTAGDVYLLKTGQVAEFAGNDTTHRGLILEPALLDYARMEIGRKFDRQQWVLHPSGLLSATLDGVRLDGEGDPFIVEAKTTSLTEGWGEPGTDAVPEKVLIQVHHQFLCVGPTVRVCYIPVLLIGYRGAEVQLYKVYRNDRLCEIVEAAGLAFMASVKNHTPPPEPPSLEVVERIQRTPKKAVTIHEELVERWLSAKAIEKSAAEQCEAARRDLLAALGDAEIGESSAGTVTYGETKSNRFDLSRFKQDQPVLAEQYLTTSTYRVLRHKAAK